MEFPKDTRKRIARALGVNSENGGIITNNMTLNRGMMMYHRKRAWNYHGKRDVYGDMIDDHHREGSTSESGFRDRSRSRDAAKRARWSYN